MNSQPTAPKRRCLSRVLFAVGVLDVLPSVSDEQWRRLSRILFAVLAIIALWTFRDYGPTWDEDVQRVYGNGVIAFYTSFFRDHSSFEFKNLYLYGGFFDLIAQAATRISPLDLYETRHLVNAAFAIAGVVGTHRLGRLLGGERTGFFAALFVALIPEWYGHGFNNPKDIPFATLHVWALSAIVVSAREVPRVSRRTIALTGVAIGLALAIRVGGAFLLGYLGIAWGTALLASWWSRADVDRRRELAGVAIRGLAAAAIAYAVMLAFWPWALWSPFVRPLHAALETTHFAWPGPLFFDGQEFFPKDVPRRYLPVWFSITLPEYVFVGLGAGAALALGRVRRLTLGPRAQEIGLVAFSILFPIAVAIAVHANVYDANRHFIFVLPSIAVLCAVVADRLAASRNVAARLALGAILASILLTILDLANLHPYQSVYFNRSIAGGLPRASQRFETDYYAQTYREGVQWVFRFYKAPPGEKTRIAGCDADFLVDHWIQSDPAAKARFEFAGIDDANVLVTTTRHDCYHKGKILHTIERKGVPLLYVIELRAPRA
jgi:4-amino-4-deoxy-L-arabinose transferase-like glycosyltransferase